MFLIFHEVTCPRKIVTSLNKIKFLEKSRSFQYFSFFIFILLKI